ncbi:MAG: CapA family protein [Lachnospiraceae bacterium]|nr:CapA family protein [Lachnospiraceae bacterium]
MLKVRKHSFIYFVIVAVIIITAIFALWWKGAFLPRNVIWNEYETAFEGGYVTLRNREMRLSDRNHNLLWKTEDDWFVQDMLVRDVDRDGTDELVLLVWKHGSYGKVHPRWVSHNDIRLEQHVFIYRWDEKEEEKIRALWMSSALNNRVESMAGYGDDKVMIDYVPIEGASDDERHTIWMWENFGLRLAGNPKETSVRVVCAGDNLVHPYLLDHIDGFDDLYEPVKPFIEAADLALVNQETVLVYDRSEVGDHPRFALPAGIADAIVDTGFDVIGLANNHMLDKGETGLCSTIDAYEKAFDETESETAVSGRIIVGASKTDDIYEGIGFLECRGVRIACLAYTYGTNGMPEPADNPNAVWKFTDEERLTDQLKYARARADVVLVMAHWGDEYNTEPNEEQKRLAYLMAQNGADVIIGSHPHVLEPFETIVTDSGHKTLVYYSLGNFVSGQKEEECRTGGLACFNIVKHKDGTTEICDENLTKIVMHIEEGDVAVHIKE